MTPKARPHKTGDAASWKVLAHMVRAGHMTEYWAKIINSRCHPVKMSCEALLNAFNTQGNPPEAFNHPDKALSALRGLAADSSNDPLLQPDVVEIVIDLDEELTRPYMPL